MYKFKYSHILSLFPQFFLIPCIQYLICLLTEFCLLLILQVCSCQNQVCSNSYINVLCFSDNHGVSLWYYRPIINCLVWFLSHWGNSFTAKSLLLKLRILYYQSMFEQVLQVYRWFVHILFIFFVYVFMFFLNWWIKECHFYLGIYYCLWY